MLDVEKLKNIQVQKKYLEEEIQKNLDFILQNINFATGHIGIHINGGKPNDYTRTFFILYTLSRVYSFGKLSIPKEKFLELFWKAWDNSLETRNKEQNSKSDMRYIELYGMRALKNLGEDLGIVLESFKKGDYATIYSYPVATYLFVSTYLECDLKNKYEFSESILNESLKVFDFLVYSSVKQKYLPFHFAEISYWKGLQDQDLKSKADQIIVDSLPIYLQNQPSSSGLAKCLEHFSRLNNLEKIKEVFDFLEARKISKFSNFVNPNFLKNEYIFSEDGATQYICLDTNAHIIHTLLNFYEK